MARAFKLKKPAESVRCEMCGEGIGPGIRPTNNRHADAIECFTALKRARANLTEIIRALEEGGHGKTRAIKLDFAIEHDPARSTELVFSVIATSSLGDEQMLARVAALVIGQMVIEAFNAGLSRREPKAAAEEVSAEEEHDSSSAN